MCQKIVDIGVFAHNEENNICRIIEELAKQNECLSNKYSVRIFILANGCTDNTAKNASELINSDAFYESFELINCEQGGKSRTWNKFVHNISRNEATHLIFCDSDIWFTISNILLELCEKLSNNQKLSVVTSKPIKDLQLNSENLSIIEKLILSSGGSLTNWKKSICGQLYVTRANIAKSMYLPIGLPVEDGFVRAMIATKSLTQMEDLSQFDGDDEYFHIYSSEKSITKLIEHQVRIVIGSSINACIYTYLRKQNPLERNLLIQQMAEDEDTLKIILKNNFPDWRFGWVPWSFLFKRVNYSLNNPKKLLSFRAVFVLLAGFGFDLIVYLVAQYRMAKGKGVGYW
tara:strand:+ start:12599 stop:13633 length:1035 start_codon:yes stop_codon:yes gene_type:complete